MREVIAYLCSFCDKMYRRKSSAIRHEKKCFANPSMRACRTCANAIKDSETVYVRPQNGENYGDSDYDFEYIYCEEKDKMLRHPDKPCGFEHNCSHYKQGEKLF